MLLANSLKELAAQKHAGNVSAQPLRENNSLYFVTMTDEYSPSMRNARMPAGHWT